MERNGVQVDTIRAVDHEIATGVFPDMTEHGWERDEWPALFERVMAADILVLLSPIWLGVKSSANPNTSFMAWNLMHHARILKDVGGIPAYGNQRSKWDAGCHPMVANPEHR